MSDKNSTFLNWLDNKIYTVLLKSHSVMPVRLAKLVAMYYTDARIRRQYANYVGLEMGEGTFANLGLKVVPNDNEICVHIGDNVSIAPNTTFVAESAPNNGQEIKELDYVKKSLCKKGDITVEDDVWIGASVTILPGVIIGKCAVIGAGAVVVSDVEPYSIYAGVPARKIRSML
ncbi:hypothetical protein FACS1894125_1320 [Actinomycetota bacterium]|nr:hypothetical protein FACS1894125_1320 [Actinomycetota bacterium]